MFSAGKLVILAFIISLDIVIKSQCEHLPFVPPLAPLLLYSPKDPEYLEVLVMSVGDNMTLICKLQAEGKPRRFVWNYLADGEARHELLEGTPTGPSLNSTLLVPALELHHTGLYVCTAPPHSLTKYIHVQEKAAACPRGALACGARCVLGAHVCDARPDCARAEDEAPALCRSVTPCDDASMVRCARGGCVSARACCEARGSPRGCVQHACCEHLVHAGSSELEYPLLFEDRHVVDDYGYIQSTIYTVTACALIFMIACVLLVSAICKMHMKRTALRTQHTRYIQAHRFPPCYSSRERDLPPSPHSPHASPAHTPQTRLVAEVVESECVGPSSNLAPGISRFGAMFARTYTQVPTHPTDVELQTVPHTSLSNSPIRTHNRTAVDQSQAPTYCDDSTDFYFTNQEAETCSRDLNYMGTFDFFRRRTLNRPLTLQLGRFQLSIPNFRRPREERRPDTPDIAEISIDDLNFVRVNSNDTYTLNGRSIRLLGANFDNYPNVSNRPPTYNEAVRVKVGPPPEYLSTDVLTTPNEASSNVEMPPRYDEVRTSESETSTPVRVVRNSVSLMAGCDGGNFSGCDPVVRRFDSHTDNHIDSNIDSHANNHIDRHTDNHIDVSMTENSVENTGGSIQRDIDEVGQCNDSNNDVTDKCIDSPVSGDGNLDIGVISDERNGESNNNAIDNTVNQSDNQNVNAKHDVSSIDAAVNQSIVTSNPLAGNSFENRSLNTDVLESVSECTNNNTHTFTNSCVMDALREVSNGNESINRNVRFNEIIDNLPAIDSDFNAND